MTRQLDHYAILNLPHNVDLQGVENAYARLSDELAALSIHDDGHKEALQRINEAYAVLSHPKARREYDAIFLAPERAARDASRRRFVRRRLWIQRGIVAVLLVVIAAQAGTLAYIGREELGTAASALFGPLVANAAG